MTRKEGQPGIINIRMCVWRGEQTGEGDVLSYWDLYISTGLPEGTGSSGNHTNNKSNCI